MEREIITDAEGATARQIRLVVLEGYENREAVRDINAFWPRDYADKSCMESCKIKELGSKRGMFQMSA